MQNAKILFAFCILHFALRMREFYLTYHEKPKLTPLVAEIGWSHNLVILERCKDDLEREFYLRMGLHDTAPFEQKAGAMLDPLPQRLVPFYGDELIAVQNPDGTIFVLFKGLCDNLGLDRFG
jgi:uncharacterized protein DUF1016